MITRTELLDILRNGENSEAELKRDDIRGDELAKELVALSNLGGGMVLLGVEDDGSVTGITRDGIEGWVMNVCRDKIRPAIIPSYATFRGLEEGKDVAIVSVPRGNHVHSLWHNNRHAYYIRVGTKSRELAPEELARLMRQRSMLRIELGPVSGAGFADLDRRRLRNYFADIREQDVPEDGDEVGWRTLLANTEIMEGDSATVAGLLLFGNNPGRYLAYAKIDATAFPGTDKDYATLERAVIKGPMVPLRDGKGELVETGLIDQAANFVRRNTGVTAKLEGGARRAEKPKYPPDAVREAIVNAVIHRDYLLANTDIELCVYSDRIEVISPGRTRAVAKWGHSRTHAHRHPFGSK